MSENPFRFGSIVTGDAFSERSHLVGRLTSAFKQGQNMAVIGPRRVGKSSLIHHAVESIPRTTLVYADFWGVHTLNDVARRCVQALESIEDKASLLGRIAQAMPGLTVSLGVDPVTGTPALTPTLSGPRRNAPESIAQIARLWASLQDGKRKIVVALDEFQDLAKIEDGDQVLGILRKEVQLLSDIPFCFSGSIRSEMGSIFTDDTGAFYKSVTILEVAGDDFDDWGGFLANQFRQSGIRIEEASLERILTVTEGIPGDAQQLCSAVWENVRGQGRKKVTPEDIQAGLVQIFADERKGYDQIVADITGQQLAVLRSLARLGGESIQTSEFLQDAGITHGSSAKAAATRLISRRILQNTAQGICFSNPFFREWLLHMRY